MAARDFDSIYESCSRLVYWAAFGVMGNDSDALDASQGAFLKVLKHMGALSLMNDAQLRGWLYRVTVNLCYDMKRRAKREVLSDDLPETTDTLFDAPEAAALSAEDRARVRAAIDGLDEPYRETVLLHYFSGLQYDEIARMTGSAEGTIKSRIFRAKQKLVALLKEGENDDR